MEKWMSLAGLVAFVGLAWILSEDRRRFDWKLVLTGVGLQFVFGVLVLWTAPGRLFFEGANAGITRVIEFSNAGSEMLFGAEFREHYFAFAVLPTIIFVSSIMAILFHLGVMQRIVQVLAKVMMRVMNVSGAESLAASANIFVGQTEAPLVIKPYVESMTRSEIMALMTGGMATVAGGVMAAFVAFGADAGHLLAASIMSAPASLVLAKIMVPERGDPVTRGVVRVDIPRTDVNILDAACRGASEGLALALNVAAMLLVFVGLAALLNWGLTFLPNFDGTPLTFERILGWIFYPIAVLTGVPLADAPAVATLLGKKMFLNEFVAFLDLRSLRESMSERAFTLSTYALCGFANFSSIAIQIGGIGNLIPKKRRELAELGVRAMIGGTLAALMTASVAGVLI